MFAIFIGYLPAYLIGENEEKNSFFQRIRLSYFKNYIKYHKNIYTKLMIVDIFSWIILGGAILSYLLTLILSFMRVFLLIMFYMNLILCLIMVIFSFLYSRWDKKRGGVTWIFDNPNHKR